MLFTPYNLTIWGIPDIILGTIFLYYTYVVYKANPKKRFNQIYTLGSLLWIISLDFMAALMFISADASTALFWRWASNFVAIPSTLLAVLYISAFPGERDFLRRNNYALILVAFGYPILFETLQVLYPYGFYWNPRPTFYGWTFSPGWFIFFQWLTQEALASYVLVRLVQLYRKTPFEIIRKQLFFLGLGIAEIIAWFLILPLLFPFFWPDAIDSGLFIDIPGIIFLALAGYAILKYQLFDIEVKLKKGVEYSILLAIFFAIVLAVQQLLQNYVQQIFGSIIGIIIGAIIIVTSFPLQHMAEDAARRVFKSASNSEAYLTWKRMEVYKAALIGALGDQQITERERRMLENLRKKLDLSTADADHLMADLQAEMQSTAKSPPTLGR